jgi:HD-GYP domain-containing protein (c-di-GMP phosphodiesterase class II)
VYTFRREDEIGVAKGGPPIQARLFRWIVALAALLALGAALTQVWWLAAVAAGLGGAAVLVLNPTDASEASAIVPPMRTRAIHAANVPSSAEPQPVVDALYESASSQGPVTAAHLWLHDSATYRLVASAGERLPRAAPLSYDDPSIAAVAASGRSSLEPMLTLKDGSDTSTLWRFALPVQGEPAAGIACIDLESGGQPSLPWLERIASEFQPLLSTALAMHVARSEAAAAASLLDAAHELSRRLRPQEVIERALDGAIALSSAATASIMLPDETDDALRIVASSGLPADVVERTIVCAGEGIAGWVYSSGKPLLVEDLPGSSGSRRRDVCSAVSVPIADEDGILGVLNVGSRDFPARFTDSHVHTLGTLGRQTAVALRNARAMESATDLYFATLTALSVALETKDPYARGATGRIVEIVRAIASAMELPAIEQQALNVAALLHDIGMSMAGGPIGGTARPLSTVERGMLKAHPVVAAEILADVPALRAVVPIVYHHHEWFDGHGYVGGLAGESIPLGSRILAVADAFVAMTSERPYRRAMSTVDAIEELVSKSGSQFDPDVVAVLEAEMRRDPALALTT